jgi:hypothetical protein
MGAAGGAVRAPGPRGVPAPRYAVSASRDMSSRVRPFVS